MKRTHTLLAAGLALAGLLSAAKAAEAPKIGPVPDWVQAAPDTPAEKDDLKQLPLTVLLNDTQFSFDADGWTEFHHALFKVQAPGGLQALGTLPFQWSPWSDTLTFHRASILRDGQTIDVLPRDGTFTVLRREPGLEQAMLTGELTALLQPEGMQVGDVLDLAISIRHADPLLKGQAGALFAGWDTTTPVGRVRLEARWPSSLPVRWRETEGLPPLRQTAAKGVTMVTLSMDDVRPVVLPAHAPARFQHGREVEFTTIADWGTVARVMAPLYAKAAELAPKSPVAAQAAMIAAAATDPKARAGAALRLVEGQVRYLAHTEASGGYTPQTADETWRLRYGDCKAKTVLLLALLHELGVPAAPVLASTAGGDGLDAHLPSMIRFNHVLVRVSLGHKDYWLDGARQGDRGLDDLATPALGWVLPLDTADGRLVHLVPEPAARPQISQLIRYDASGGAAKPIPTQLKTTFRGDGAFVLQAELSAVPPERLDAALKAYWASVHTAFTAAHVAAAWDPSAGEETLTADGTSKLEMSDAGLELQNVELGGAPDIKRDPATNDPDAPYLVDFPSWVETDESVLTPPDSAPSAETLKSVDVDAVIAGVAYRRSGTAAGHVFRVVASQRALQPEISAAQARASVDPLTKLGEQGVYVNVRTAAANPAAAIDSHPTTLDGHLDRGNALLDAERFHEAVGEFDAAIALDPKSQKAWADRAIARAWLADPAATADADRADALGPPEIVAARARAVLAARTHDAAGARAAYGRALALAPGDAFSLAHLIDLDLAASEVDAARAHLAQLLNAHPEQVARAHLWNALIEHAAHHHAAAERELSDAPWWTSGQRLERARVYLAIGDKALARADLDAAIRLQPSVPALLLRADVEGGPDSAVARADVEAALKLDPMSLAPRMWLMRAALYRREFPAAPALIDKLLTEHPELAGDLLVERAQVDGHLGRETDMDADFSREQTLTGAAAPQPAYLCRGATKARWRPQLTLEACSKALKPGVTSTTLQLDEVILLHRLGREAEALTSLDSIEATTSDAEALNDICYDLAVENIALDRALAACDASLKRRPGNAATLDSRGFVLMRLGRDAEALAAYDAALAVDPKLYISLYGRGLVEARLGRQAEATRDTAAALAARPYIRDEFADYGLR